MPDCAVQVIDYDAVQAAASCPRYAAESHKYDHGTLVVAGGSRRYSGAPMLAATSALYAGAGVVIACVPSSAEILCHVPQALIVHRLAENAEYGVFGAESLEGWHRELRKATALVLGPGLDNQAVSDAFLAEALAFPAPKVVDADALNRIAANPALLPSRECRARMVLTPHAGEFARLAKAFGLPGELSREEGAWTLARTTGCVVLLKGPGTLVASPEGSRLTRNTTGNPRLGTAGSGDVLSGVIGALLAQGVPAAEAARLGAFLHGRAADELPFFIADDLPKIIAKILHCGLY